MHPALRELFLRLRDLRQAAGLSAAEVEESLALGPGWVEWFETGEYEPSLGMLATLVGLYGSSLSNFFSGLSFGAGPLIPDRHLTVTQENADLRLHFPMGQYAATVAIPNSTVAQFTEILKVMRDQLATGQPREAIVECFLTAVKMWPHANPSDLWYFLLCHAYQDDYNHPAMDAGRNWEQSWKRASGWAFEDVILKYYNPYLAQQGIRLAAPPPAERSSLLKAMGIPNPDQAAAKADVVALGKRADNTETGFGVVHIKASFAERRTDDVPLSQQLIARGFASPFVTMDCKAKPSSEPINRGELGAVHGGEEVVSAKRSDIERDNNFDACFSYNSNTKPTPAGQQAAARIMVCGFSNPDDAFSKHLVRKWRQRQGLD